MVRLGRDGGVQQFENSGLLTLRITDEAYGRILLKLSPSHTQGLQLQTHPNVDKELFKSRNTIGLKNLGKPFPLNTDVGVLKWRFVSQDESAIPLTSKCSLDLPSLSLMPHHLSLFFNSQLLAVGQWRRWLRCEHRV